MSVFRLILLTLLWPMAFSPTGWLLAQPTGSVLHLRDAVIDQARLEDWNESGWSFRVPNTAAPQTFSTNQIIRWGHWRGIVGRQGLWLSDGSWLAGDVQLTADSVRLVHRWLDTRPIPIRQVRAILFSPVASLADWISMENIIRSTTGVHDIVWLNDRRRIAGIVNWNQLKSTTDNLTIDVDGQSIKVPLVDVSTIIFSPALLGDLPQAALKIGLADGSLLCVSRLRTESACAIIQLPSLGEMRSMDLPTSGAQAVTLLSATYVDKVQRLDQLTPSVYRHLSDNQLEFSLGVNQTVRGGPLITGRRPEVGIVFHGLAMHSSSQAAYRWDGTPGQFLAELQLVDPTAPVGDAHCKVLVARGDQLQVAREISLPVGDRRSHVVQADLSEVRMVVLVVERATKGQYGDQVMWLDARFVKP